MQKTVNSNHGLVLFNPLSGASTQDKSGSGSYDNKWVLCILQSSGMTGIHHQIG